MHLALKLANDVLRPWERLNAELINKSSVDSNISDFVSIAEDLCVKLSHFPELSRRKSLRSDKTSPAFAAVVDVADTLKHGVHKKGRANSLAVSSMFEGNDEGRFRFIRNRVIIDHEMYGKLDFLEASREAVDFLIRKLGLNLFWKPTILEAPEVFDDKVSLDIYFTHQITWTGLTIEFVKRTAEGEFKHFNPPSWLFELRSAPPTNAISYFEYIAQLLQRSIAPPSGLVSKTAFPILGGTADESFLADFAITTIDRSKRVTTIVQVIDNASGDTSDVEAWEQLVRKTGVDNIILVSQRPFSRKVEEQVSLSLRNVYLIEVEKFDAYSIPIRFFSINYTENRVRLTALHSFRVGVSKEDAALFEQSNGWSIGSIGRVFSRDKTNLMSAPELCLSLLKPRNHEKKGKKATKYSPKGDTQIYLKRDDKFIRIGLELDFEWEVEAKEMRMPILHYERSELGVSIWSLKGWFLSTKGIFGMSIPVTKYGDTSAVGIIAADVKAQTPQLY